MRALQLRGLLSRRRPQADRIAEQSGPSSSGEHDDTMNNVDAFNGLQDGHAWDPRPFVAQTVFGKVDRPRQQDGTDNERMPTIYALSPWPSPRTFRKRVK
jgi:hypothetical protein